MSPEIVTSRTENIAIIILVVVVFALGGLLVYFIKKSVVNQEKEREKSQDATEEMKTLLLSQIDMLNVDLSRREKENREDRQRHEDIQQKSQEKFTQALNHMTEQLTDKLDNISCDLGIVKNDVEQLKDKT